MANKNTYCGWKNRETWLVSLWYSHSWASVEDVYLSEIILQEKYDDLGSSFLQDMIDFDAIDWEQLRSHMADVVAEQMEA